MNTKKFARSFMGIIMTVSYILLIQAIAVIGTANYTNAYAFCYKQDAGINKEGYEGIQNALDFLSLETAVLSDYWDETALDGRMTDEAKSVFYTIHKCVRRASNLFPWLLALCIAGVTYCMRHRQHKPLKWCFYGSLAAPFVMFAVVAVWHLSSMKELIAFTVFSRYTLFFGEDEALLSILPKGLFLTYGIGYLVFWLAGTLIPIVIYNFTARQRRPHAF